MRLRLLSLITLGNVPDLARLERFLAAIGQQEDEIFRERIANEAEFQARRRKFAKRNNGRGGGGGGGNNPETEAEQQQREMTAANAFEEAMAAQVLLWSNAVDRVWNKIRPQNQSCLDLYQTSFQLNSFTATFFNF